MPIALVAQAKGNGNTDYSTASLNSTGADLLVVCWCQTSTGTGVISDSKGNTWNTAILHPDIWLNYTQMSYCIPTSVGTGHTVTITGGNAGSAQFHAFSGAATFSPLDQSNAGTDFGSTATTPGPITPTEDGELIVAYFNFDNNIGMAIDGGFSTMYGDPGSGGVYLGSASAYLIQTTAAVADPTLSTTGSSNKLSVIVSFKAAAGGPPPTTGALVAQIGARSQCVGIGPSANVSANGYLGARAQMVGVGPQHSRPISDVLSGGWTSESGGTSGLFNSVDEPVANSADYIQSSLRPVNDAVRLHMQPISIPQSGPRWLAYTFRKTAADGAREDLLVELLQGATVLQSWTHTDVGATEATVVQEVTATISDGSQLDVRMTAVEV